MDEFFADKWWQLEQLKDKFEDALLKFVSDYDTIGTDNYDASLEIYKSKEIIDLEGLKAFVKENGFVKLYINYEDKLTQAYNL